MAGDEVPPGFDWDPAKASRNAARHGVTFLEAVTAFADPVAFAREDEEHSEIENRFHVIGRSAAGRLVTVCYTMRGDSTRIVSAWSASAEDRREYHEQIGD
jgi:uncharacterized protein